MSRGIMEEVSGSIKRLTRKWGRGRENVITFVMETLPPDPLSCECIIESIDEISIPVVQSHPTGPLVLKLSR